MLAVRRAVLPECFGTQVDIVLGLVSVRTCAGGPHDGGEAGCLHAASNARQHARPFAPPQPEPQVSKLHLQPQPARQEGTGSFLESGQSWWCSSEVGTELSWCDVTLLRFFQKA